MLAAVAWILGIFIVAPIMITLLSNEDNEVSILRKNNRKRLDKYFQDNFNSLEFDSKYLSLEEMSGVLLNRKNNEIILLSSGEDKSIHHKTYSINDIVESEIVVDGQSVTRSSRASQFKGLVVGGVIGGGLGAAVGGLSGVKEDENRVKRMDLKLVLNDFDDPIHTVNFLTTKANDKKYFLKSDEEYMRADSDINEWHERIKMIIEN